MTSANKIKTLASNHFIFILILILALFLRAYKIETLTTFGRDQGIDFLVIKDMIQNHHWTLIGIKVSIANFFQGPVYLYMLLLPFWLLKLDPLAGSYSAVLVSMLTIVTLYIFTFKTFGTRAANLAAIFFAVAPPLVMFGNTPLYQNFVPLFILLCLSTLFLLIDTDSENHLNKKVPLGLLTGFFAGISCELHFLSVTFAISVLLYFILFIRRKLLIISSYISGLIIGLSLTLAFELRHDFLNTKLVIQYLSQQTGGNLSFNGFFIIWFKRIIYFSSNDYNFLAIPPLLLGLYIILFGINKSTPYFKSLRKLAIIVFITTVAFSLKISSFGFHFPLPFWIILIVLIPGYLSIVKMKNLTFLAIALMILNFTVSLSMLRANHGYFMPEGWNLKKIKLAGELVTKDSKDHLNFNVASLLDGDTRAYPLRYVVEINGGTPGSVENYPNNNSLYVVSRNEKALKESKTWEINCFYPFKINKIGDLSDNIYLYRLDRTNI